MEKVRQKLTAVREHWLQILIACGALALAFGLGMSFQAEREDAAEEAQFQESLRDFGNRMEIFSTDVNRTIRQSGETASEPLESLAIQNDLAVIRRSAASFLDMAYLPQFNAYPGARLYLTSLEPALLGDSCEDFQALSQMVTICRPLWDANPGGPLEETMALLEENVTSGEYEEALDLLDLELDPNGDLVLTGA